MPNIPSEDSVQFYALPFAGPKPAPPFGFTWPGLMAMAYKEAETACRYGDVPVGALVASADGEILSLTANRVERDHNPVAHAEILALVQAAHKMASTRLPGAVLVTTLEPCLMCATAIAKARVAGVVYGASDKTAGAIHSAADLVNLPLGAPPFWHMGGIMGASCANLLNHFFKQLRLNK